VVFGLLEASGTTLNWSSPGSVVLGAIVVVGLALRSVIESRTDWIVVVVLILTGVAFLLAKATGHTRHHDHGHDQLPGEPRAGSARANACS
jgi:undecaprenyl pyrophosphate phosphatase UppP